MYKSYRRLFKSLIILLGCMLLFTACGPKEEAVQPSASVHEGLSFLFDGGGENLDVAVENNAFYDVASDLKGPYDESTSDDGKFLGMQFYQGESVQLWASAPYSESGGYYVSVYMYRQDGTRETCLERVERTTGQKIVFRDSEGYCYSISKSMKGDSVVDSIVKLDSSGKSLYMARLDGDRGAVEMICELADGRLAVLVSKGSGRVDEGIVLLDASGKLSALELSEQFPGKLCYLGTSEEGLLLIKGEELYRVGIPDGKLEQVFSFAQTSYAMGASSRPPGAFRVCQDGKLELLRADRQGSGTCEILSLAETDGSRQKVFLRGYAENARWLKEQVMKFNSTNNRYQVVLEGPEQWNDIDYITRTGVELAAGKGPDILMESMIESPESLIEKGGLLDLAPLMEQAGIREEDYFPIAFDTWRKGNSIYSIMLSSDCEEKIMSSAVLGDNAPEQGYPDIETVVDALLAYPENAVYDGYSSAGDILCELMEGSETLWGMVDWENGTCDFGGELFGKLLEVAKRYQYDARNNYPAICSDRNFGTIYDFYTSPTEAETRAEGNVPVGTFYDDGSHLTGIGNLFDSLSINANAVNKEGAWEFLRFLLSEEMQVSMPESAIYVPVKKSAYWAVVEEEILNGPMKNYNYKGEIVKDPLSREKAEEIEALLGNVRALPCKTETILEIVLEEAQEYFNGVKEIPQVADAVENRVGLYLKERK